MSSRLHIIAFATTGLALLLCEPVTASEPKLTAAQSQIVDTVNTIFTAARTDDVAKFDSVIAPDFYIFDAGARFNGDSIMAFIIAQHRAGKRYEWNITEPDVHVSGKTAWVAYVNKGSIGDAAGTVNQNWLESAFLQKQAGVWKIAFMHRRQSFFIFSELNEMGMGSMAAPDGKSRLEALRKLLSQGKLSTQDELREELEERKFAVTQSTISRDLRRVGAVGIGYPDVAIRQRDRVWPRAARGRHSQCRNMIYFCHDKVPPFGVSVMRRKGKHAEVTDMRQVGSL